MRLTLYTQFPDSSELKPFFGETHNLINHISVDIKQKLLSKSLHLPYNSKWSWNKRIRNTKIVNETELRGMELCAIFPEGFRDFLNWNILLFNNKSIHIRSNVLASCVVDKDNIFDLVKIKPEHSSCIVSRLRRTLENNQLTLCFIRLRHLRTVTGNGY